MRICISIAILLLLLAAPVTRLDVAKLQPVEVVAVYKAEDRLVLRTDTDSSGEGRTVKEALGDLKDKTPTVVYLDTAQYLLVADNARDCVEELKHYLKGSVKVGSYQLTDPATEALHQETHSKMTRLRDWNKQE